MVWDRRAIQRSDASPSYLEAVDHDAMPWGGALQLNKAMQMEADPASVDSKNSFIRALRFCRDRPGVLAVLSRTGQLKILSTRHEYIEPEARLEASPELLEVRRSHEMDPIYAESSRKNDKIVSFDWVSASSPVLQPRMLVLRANGAFDVLETPSFTSEYPFNLIPWQAPHRGLEGRPVLSPPLTACCPANDEAEGCAYHQVMEFEPSQARNILGPLLSERVLEDKPLFGPNKINVQSLLDKASVSDIHAEQLAIGDEVRKGDFSATLSRATSIAEKLAALRLALKETTSPHSAVTGVQAGGESTIQRDRHEKLLIKAKDIGRFPTDAQVTLDHAMLLRAKENYLFNYERNQQIVADDPWLRDVWAWVTGNASRP